MHAMVTERNEGRGSEEAQTTQGRVTWDMTVSCACHGGEAYEWVGWSGIWEVAMARLGNGLDVEVESQGRSSQRCWFWLVQLWCNGCAINHGVNLL